jgi:hypothetical protein
LHFEVKQPKDKFKNDGIQSRGYALRAQCWVANPPANVLPHHRASTALLFSEQKRAEYAPHLSHFNTLITFEDIATAFPHLAVWSPECRDHPVSRPRRRMRIRKRTIRECSDAGEAHERAVSVF